MDLYLTRGSATLKIQADRVISYTPLKIIYSNKIFDLTEREIKSITHPVNKSHNRRKKKWQENQR